MRADGPDVGWELALAGVDVAIVGRRSTPVLVGSRAAGFHSRTLEILDQRGIADRFLAEGQIAQAARFGTVTLDVSDFPSRYPSGIRTRWGCGRTASSEPSGLAVCRSNVKLPPQSKRLEVAGSRNLQES